MYLYYIDDIDIPDRKTPSRGKSPRSVSISEATEEELAKQIGFIIPNQARRRRTKKNMKRYKRKRK